MILLLATLIVLLQFSSLRNRILAGAVRKMEDSFPGSLRVEVADWSFPATLELDGIDWVDGSDTLLTADHLDLSVSLRSLLQRDLRVSDLRIEVEQADIPGIQIRFAGREERPEDKATGKRFFPRKGSLPNIPSVAFDQIDLTAGSVRFAEGILLEDVAFGGGVDLTAGTPPRFWIVRLFARDPEREWFLDEASLDFDLVEGIAEGSARGRLSDEWPFYFSLDSRGFDRFALKLTDTEDAGPPEGVGFELQGEWIRSGGSIRSIRYTGLILLPGTEDLSRSPDLAVKLKDLPTLERLPVSLEGSLHLVPAFAFDLSAEMRSHPPIDGGELHIRYEDGILTVDTLKVQLPDLQVGANLRLEENLLSAQMDVRSRGARWLPILFPESEPPESLSLDLSARFYGPKSHPGGEVTLEARANKGKFRIDRLFAIAEIPASPSQPVLLSLEGEAAGFRLTANAEMDRGEVVRVRLRPLLLHEVTNHTEVSPAKADPTGEILYDPASKKLDIRGVRLVGALGNLRLDGDIHETQEGSWQLEWDWREPPSAMLQYLKLSPEESDSLRIRWTREQGGRLRAGGKMSRLPEGTVVTCSGELAFPGPRAFSHYLPSGARVDDLGSLRGRFELTSRFAPVDSGLRISLDFAETNWLDSARVVLQRSGDHLDIETLMIGMEGFRFDLKGRTEAGSLDADAQINLSDARFLRRFNATMAESLDLDLSLAAKLDGPLRAPGLHALFEGMAASPRFHLPSLEGEAVWIEGRRALLLKASEGLIVRSVPFDSVTLNYEALTEDGGLLPGRLSVEARGPGLGVVQSARIERDQGWSAWFDTLAIFAREQDLRSTAPFHISFEPERRSLHIQDLNLVGSAGSFRASGFTGSDSSDLHARCELILPDQSPIAFEPASLWPERVNLSLHATGRNDLQGEVSVSGFDWEDRRGLEAFLRIDASAGIVRSDLSILDVRDSVLVGNAALPAQVVLYPPQVILGQGPVALSLLFSNLPIPLQKGEPTGRSGGPPTALMSGHVNLGGTAEEPFAWGDASAAFPRSPGYEAYGLLLDWEITQGVVSRSGSSATRNHSSLLHPRSVARPAGGGMAAALEFRKGNAPLVFGEISLPLSFSIAPLRLEPRADREMRLGLKTEDLSLKDISPFLPPNVGLEGRCDIKISAEGPVDNLDLDGLVVGRKLKVSLANGSRVAAGTEIRLAGTARHPVASGSLKIDSGIIRVPEQEKVLHPVSGGALLWGSESETVEADDPFHRGGEGRSSAGGKSLPAREVDLDVEVQIPSGLWVRGRGLNVELAGNLRVMRRGTLPTVAGELEAVDGRFLFLGRSFRVNRGKAVFYGDDEMNPSLDLELSTNIEGTLIRILLEGTVQNPRLTLASDPEMLEEDIISILMFGRPTDELNSGQMDLLQSRASHVATSFAMVQLEARFAHRLNVDILTFRQRSDETDQNSLVIGKYISRRVLLKYEQALEDWSEVMINFEYFLNRSFKLETLIGHQNQSGLEVGWSREY